MKALLLAGLVSVAGIIAAPVNAGEWTHRNVDRVVTIAIDRVGEARAPELLRTYYNECIEDENQGWTESCEVYAAASWFMMGLQTGYEIGYLQGFADGVKPDYDSNYGL